MALESIYTLLQKFCVLFKNMWLITFKIFILKYFTNERLEVVFREACFLPNYIIKLYRDLLTHSWLSDH